MYKCNKCGNEFETPIKREIWRKVYRRLGEDDYTEDTELEEMDTCPKCESEDIRNENYK